MRGREPDGGSIKARLLRRALGFPGVFRPVDAFGGPVFMIRHACRDLIMPGFVATLQGKSGLIARCQAVVCEAYVFEMDAVPVIGRADDRAHRDGAADEPGRPFARVQKARG